MRMTEIEREFDRIWKKIDELESLKSISDERKFLEMDSKPPVGQVEKSIKSLKEEIPEKLNSKIKHPKSVNKIEKDIPGGGTETHSKIEVHRENSSQTIDSGVGEVETKAKTSGKYRASLRRERLTESSPQETKK